MVAHQYFAGGRCRHRSLPDRKVFGLRNTRGPGRQNNLPVFHQHHFSTATTVTTSRIPTLDNQGRKSALLRIGCAMWLISAKGAVRLPTPTGRLVDILSSRRRSEEQTSELQSLMLNSYAVFFLKNKKPITHYTHPITNPMSY